MARQFIRCNIVDASFEKGAGEVLLNTRNLAWICKHPTNPNACLVKMGDGAVLAVLASLRDMQHEIEAMADA
jgi:hypothetical protein